MFPTLTSDGDPHPTEGTPSRPGMYYLRVPRPTPLDFALHAKEADNDIANRHSYICIERYIDIEIGIDIDINTNIDVLNYARPTRETTLPQRVLATAAD